MGRRTWESLPAAVRPLPGRRNVVLTRTPAGRPTGPSRRRRWPRCSAGRGDLWVIGGGSVYAAFLPHADRVVVTEVDADVDGDTWAPAARRRVAAVARTPAERLVGVRRPGCGTRCRSTATPTDPAAGCRAGR